MVHKDLFGGAIVVDDFPDGLIDASDLRQVPDNQEVFLYPDSNISVVIEVLQRVLQEDDEEAVKFHFEALAHDNDAISYTIEAPMHHDLTPCIILRGSQRIRKFNQTDVRDVDILIALFRVQSGDKSADVVVSENIPGGEKDEKVVAAFDSLVSSFRIIDYGLFC